MAFAEKMMNAVFVDTTSVQPLVNPNVPRADNASSRVTAAAQPLLSAAQIECSFHCDKLEPLWIFVGIVAVSAFVVGLSLGIALSPWYYLLILIAPVVLVTMFCYSGRNYKFAVLRTANEIMDAGTIQTEEKEGKVPVELKNCNDLTWLEIHEALPPDANVELTSAYLDDMDGRRLFNLTITSNQIQQFQKKKKAAVGESLNSSKSFIHRDISNIISEY